MRNFWVVYIGIFTLLVPATGSAMHISEGFLPKEHAIGWWAIVLPFLLFGVRKINSLLQDHPERKMLLGLAAAFIFVLSALKMPSVTGSTSHPTGVGLAAVLFGPYISVVLSGIVLAFQALLLAHGGITTWGANLFSMGVMGAFSAWAVFCLARKLGGSERVAVFTAAALGDWITYLVTAGQLALAFPDPVTGLWGAYAKFLGIFAITQVPLAVCEGILSVVVYNSLQQYADAGIITMWWRKREGDA